MRAAIALVGCLALLHGSPASAKDEPGAPDESGDAALANDAPPAERAPASAPAAATPAPAPDWPGWLRGGRIAQPPSFAWLPLESGALDTHVELMLAYTHVTDVGTKVRDAVMLALEGQYAIADVFEVGLTIPFLTYQAVSYGVGMDSEAEFGNIALDLKGKIYGQSKGRLAISAFLNTTLPTSSGLKTPTGLNISLRDWAAMQGGGALSGAVGIVTMGMDLGVWWFINNIGVKSPDLVAMLFDFYFHVQIHRIFAAYAAFQIAGPVHPDTEDAAFTITPGVRLTPFAGLFLDVAGRIAATDAGRAIHALLGRGDLIFNLGYRF